MPLSPSRATDAGRAQALARLIAHPFAHRGLHGAGRVENSRAAFLAAIEAGYGIELDVQASRDGAAFVFHDSSLARLTGRDAEIGMMAAADIRRIALLGGSETIPILSEVLALVAGRAPVLIELKASRGKAPRLCAAVASALDGYEGPAAVMGFNPQVGAWFARRAPHILRGLVVTEEGRRGLRGRVERALATWHARVDFLAYDIRDLPSPFATTMRVRGIRTLTWTVRTERDRATAAAHADQIIFEAGQA